MHKIKIRLAPDEVRLLQREVTGQGGWQDVARGLQQALVLLQDGSADLELTFEEAERVLDYYRRYGRSGGWQQRMGPVAFKLHRALQLERGATETTSPCCLAKLSVVWGMASTRYYRCLRCGTAYKENS